MSEKTISHKPVVLRKSLVGAAFVGLSLIMMLIIYNLYQSTHEGHKLQNTTNVIRVMANQGDVNWYQHKKSTPSDLSSHSPIMQHTISTQLDRSHEISQNSPEDVVKAMSAPITTNQLISDVNYNKSGEKKILLEATQHPPENDYLSSALANPINAYELQAGAVIPAILITGINSDLPGQIIGQVKTNIYDSIAGKYLLIPQGAKVTGVYDSRIVYGQERVMIAWHRIIFPNGQSINLQQMPGSDSSGYSGFHDEVNNHYAKIFGSVLLMSVLGAGAQLSQPPNNNNSFAAPSVGQTIAQSVGTNIANTATVVTEKNLGVKPTLEIRPGYEFNISVTKDIVFPGPYRSADQIK